MLIKALLVLALIFPVISRWVWKLRLKKHRRILRDYHHTEANELRGKQISTLLPQYPHLSLIPLSRKLGEFILPFCLIVLTFACFSSAIPLKATLLIAGLLIDGVILLNLWSSSQEINLIKNNLRFFKNSTTQSIAIALSVRESYPKSLWGKLKRP